MLTALLPSTQISEVHRSHDDIWRRRCTINFAQAKANTRSSTEAELIATDDVSIMVLWTKLFMEAQGHKINQNIMCQDNKSTILMLNNGKRSSGKRTRAFNIRYFFLTDQIEKGHLAVEYCPTTGMVADYMSKPLQGKLFQKFRKAIMGN